MKTHILIFFLSIFLVSCKNTEDKRQGAKNSTIELSMDSNANLLLLDSTINALSIGVYKDGKTYINHYGELDKGKGNKPTDETIYEIGSVSKIFAGTLVAQAVVEGKLNLEDDIRKYLKEDFPNLEYQEKSIRIKHLITHTSRLPKFLPKTITEIVENPTDSLVFKIYEIEKNYSKEKFLTDLHTVVLDTIPGTKDGYSSADTELVAHILENIYNKSYNELLQEKIAIKLRLKNTGTVLPKSHQHNLANGYIKNNTLAPSMINTLWGAGGGMITTMPDLMKYVEFQLNKENEVATKSHQVVFQNGDFRIGYYWPIRFDESYGTYYSHHGGAFGIQNYLFIFPEKDMGISVILNQNLNSKTYNKLIKVAVGIMEDLK
ncbi:serine hydrolase domain-containing protein [uncultured Croceitalea sp.]|uniref:serine hydrolase domain-containing protein n=1 Tax=uncultured Croceitalea sp. TaxID=1798908 RepID=UPI00374F1ACA